MEKCKIEKIMSNTEPININDWQYFIVGNEFKVLSTKNREASKYNNGKVPFVASGSQNNGIELYVETSEVLEDGNCITFSTIDCSAFYQKRDFIGRGHGAVIRLYHEKLNEKNALFLCTVLKEFLGQKYDYNNQCWQNVLENEKIKLPAVKNSNDEYEIDWQYMEDFIKKVQEYCL